MIELDYNVLRSSVPMIKPLFHHERLPIFRLFPFGQGFCDLTRTPKGPLIESFDRGYCSWGVLVEARVLGLRGVEVQGLESRVYWVLVKV